MTAIDESIWLRAQVASLRGSLRQSHDRTHGQDEGGGNGFPRPGAE
ncbi:hypothetical protein [Thermomonospora echinospora]|nr:hypothetical protein [Thermomonospora echinospora]